MCIYMGRKQPLQNTAWIFQGERSEKIVCFSWVTQNDRNALLHSSIWVSALSSIFFFLGQWTSRFGKSLLSLKTTPPASTAKAKAEIEWIAICFSQIHQWVSLLHRSERRRKVSAAGKRGQWKHCPDKMESDSQPRAQVSETTMEREKSEEVLGRNLKGVNAATFK